MYLLLARSPFTKLALMPIRARVWGDMSLRCTCARECGAVVVVVVVLKHIAAACRLPARDSFWHLPAKREAPVLHPRTPRALWRRAGSQLARRLDCGTPLNYCSQRRACRRVYRRALLSARAAPSSPTLCFSIIFRRRRPSELSVDARMSVSLVMRACKCNTNTSPIKMAAIVCWPGLLFQLETSWL
jgi:hypothetical protein